MKKILLSIIVVAAIAIIPGSLVAQPDPTLNGDGSSVSNDPVGPTGSPIDGGLSILLSLGLIYGIKKGLSLRGKDDKS
jgi:hypothetical protein